MEKTDIKSFSQSELMQFVESLGEKRFRAKQIYNWIHVRNVADFDEMSDLSKQLRERLKESATLVTGEIERKLVSKIDGTVKYLIKFADGNCVESVLMKYKHGNSLCVSTEVGCLMGCKFCASTLKGLERRLAASEILEQVYLAQRDSGESVDSIVLMGIGEPLDNYENVLKFLRLISDENGRNLSLRHVSLSTCGLVDKIDLLAKEKLQLTLSISLHASNDEIRNGIMPVNKKYNIGKLMSSCRSYIETTGRRISFEYAMIDGVNDNRECASELARLLKGMLCHVNIIPINEVREREYKKSSQKKTEDFVKILEKSGITVTVRRKLGADIEAACGQLRIEHS